MIREYSYGIIPLRQIENEWEVLLIQHGSGHWAFPKGHADGGETPLQTAARELKEETNLDVEKYLSDQPIEESYFFTFKGKKIYKTVRYFIAQVKGHVRIQEEEIQASRWVRLSQAGEYVTFAEAKKICSQIPSLLKDI